MANIPQHSLWRISRNILHKATNACPVLFASAEAEHNNEPLRRKLIAYFLHKIMRRRVRRLAQQDAFARTTLKEECSLLFALSFFAVPALWRISRNILRRASSSLKKFSARLSSHENHSERSYMHALRLKKNGPAGVRCLFGGAPLAVRRVRARRRCSRRRGRRVKRGRRSRGARRRSRLWRIPGAF